MEQRTSSPYPAIDRVVLALIGVVLVIGIVSFFLQKKLRKKSLPAQA